MINGNGAAPTQEHKRFLLGDHPCPVLAPQADSLVAKLEMSSDESAMLCRSRLGSQRAGADLPTNANVSFAPSQPLQLTSSPSSPHKVRGWLSGSQMECLKPLLFLGPQAVEMTGSHPWRGSFWHVGKEKMWLGGRCFFCPSMVRMGEGAGC